MYPNKVDASGNPWKLPFLPGESFFIKLLNFQKSMRVSLISVISLL